MITISDTLKIFDDIALLLAQIGINSQNPNYSPIFDIIKGLKDQADRIKVKILLEDLVRRVHILENKQGSIEYFSSQRFVQELSALLYSQQLDNLNEKKCLYANYFISCCRCASIEKLNTQKYYSLLQSLDILEYHILTLIPEINIAACNASSLYRRINVQFPESTKEDVRMRLEVLKGNNLTKTKTFQEINMCPNRNGNIRARGEDEYYIRTTLGTKFLLFVKEK